MEVLLVFRESLRGLRGNARKTAEKRLREIIARYRVTYFHYSFNSYAFRVSDKLKDEKVPVF